MTDKVKLDIPDSPDFFPVKTKGRGVRRLNNLPLIGAIGIVSLALIGITYTFMLRQQSNNISEEEKKLLFVDETPLPVRPEGNDYVQAKLPEILPLVSTNPTEIQKIVEKDLEQKQIDKALDEENETQKRLLTRIVERRLAKMEAALDSEPMVSFTINSRIKDQTQIQNEDPQKSMLENLLGRSGIASNASFNGDGGRDPNMQAQKIAFLSQSPEAEVYLKNTRQEAIQASLEIKAGTIIPGVMISGVNSDLPGQIIAQVRESVYDSATGQNVLIPMGSRLIGTYDSRVSTGQKRVLIAWSRVIYPDGSSLSLGNMPGSDQSGYAGFNDKVNNHYLKIFGNALMLSVISGASQMSQKTQKPGSDDSKIATAKETLAAELGRQWGEVGIEMTRKNLNIQPTITIRPGYNFNVMVTKDIILPAWQGHPMAALPY
ncbi:TrbI/VirB10 family protein (plasmid) [Bartonella heixiaziensis]|uniref:TrbI/VirB10 family protein n=1 Tax=Bartonella heixiaziensis TaxID=1461000 RepID=UPI003F4EF998